jgi:hypothetical protein
MKCVEAREILSAYIDEMLGAKEKKALEKHLLSCRNCSLELAALRKTIAAVGGISRRKAPADFLSKVHERTTRRSEFERMMRKAFFPKIKMPLEFAGVLATVLLVAVALKYLQPEKRVFEISRKSHQVATDDSKIVYPAPEDLFTKEKEQGPVESYHKGYNFDLPASPVILQGINNGFSGLDSSISVNKALNLKQAIGENRAAVPDAATPPVQYGESYFKNDSYNSMSYNLNWDMHSLSHAPVESQLDRSQSAGMMKGNLLQKSFTGLGGSIEKNGLGPYQERNFLIEPLKEKASFEPMALTIQTELVLPDVLIWIKGVVEKQKGSILVVESGKDTTLPQSIIIEILPGEFNDLLENLKEKSTLQDPVPVIDTAVNHPVKVQIKIKSSS